LIISQTPIEFKESTDLDRVNQFNIHDYIASNNSALARPRKVSLGLNKSKGGQQDNSRVPKLPSLPIGHPEEETTPKGVSVKPALGIKANHDRSLTQILESRRISTDNDLERQEPRNKFERDRDELVHEIRANYYKRVHAVIGDFINEKRTANTIENTEEMMKKHIIKNSY